MAKVSAFKGFWIRIIEIASHPSTSKNADPVPELPTIFFQDLQGKSITLQSVPINTTVKRLKDLLHAKREEYDPLSVRMIYAGKELRDGELVRATSVT